MSALGVNKQINKKISEIGKKQNIANQNVVSGRLTQAKGIVLEQLGNVANDDRMKLVGKRDQIAGRIRANYCDKWLVRNRGWLFLSTAVAVIAAFIFLRNSNS
jgi:uncharacterized protein YjbJ (UPF0337 family)